MNHSARRVNALAQGSGARRYLEIGVRDGATFLDVAIAERTGVDPEFCFDTSLTANGSTRYVAQTSDEFFASQALLPPYDIVFIDGLHVFAQVARDFSNALLRTGPDGAILIDDTLPSDVYSAIPDFEAACRYRLEAGGEGTKWHGDVFKIVFYIHDFWPGLNYRTMIGSGNPQTLVWRADGIRRTPVFDDFERIARLTYFDLLAHIEVLQCTSEEDAIALCRAQSGRST